ncbi:TonB-dependent receptor [Colwellia chukchiensis]|uniref:TonB-dependent receptor n=1 Tax=Colwellia chukchiensis TaxID=641665 RepID=A0A1H7Q9Q4_9GAMM|nr:TonB-dependent receptor [Colwellia chukchiensis]SEL44606.1 TonB-dependent receptor [Colwellia chukchiensis]
MKHFTFSKKHLAVCIAAIIGAGFNVQALAAEAEEATEQNDNMEVITVSGIRGSLLRSMSIKRDMSGVVDAISAEEMGKFPDTNLAESLQRITGVSVSRSNGEGSQITVRGFGPDFNLVTLNGRQMAGTGFTRSFNFENLSSEGVSSLQIMKTARAEVPTGGLGATVNIVTAKPLQNQGEKFSFMAKGMHDSSVVAGDDITPEVAGIYSNTFADDRFGVSANFSYHRRDFQRQSANVRSWLVNPSLSLDENNIIDNRHMDAEGNVIGQFFDPSVGENGEYIAASFFPQEISFAKDDIQRERTNAQVTLQFAASDDLIFTLDHTVSNAVTGNNSLSWGMWNGSFGGNANAYELDENGTAIYYNSAGDDGSFTSFRETNEVDSKATGLNIEWYATDNLSFTLDAHTSKTTTDNGKDKGLGANARVILGSADLANKEYFFRDGDIPGFNINWNNGSQEISPNQIGSNFSIFTRTPGESEVSQIQLDGELLIDTNFGLETLKFGSAYTKQTLSGWGGSNNANAPGFNNGTFAEIFPDSMFERVDLGDFLDQFAFGAGGVAPGYAYTFNLDEAFTRQALFLTQDVVGSDVYQVGTFDGFPVNKVEEETISVYLSSDWAFQVSGYDVQVNLGVRYEETDIVSPAKSRVAEQVYWAGGSEWMTEFASGGELVTVDYEGKYDLLLPMLDIKVDLSDELVARASWGQTITRPTLGDMLGNLSLTSSPKLNSRSGSRGNPNLQPFKSTNVDLTLEYYYGDASYAAVGLFWKDVDDWIDNAEVKTTFDGLHDVYLGQRWNNAVAAIEGRGEQATDAAIYNEIVANGVGIGENNRILPDSGSDPLIEWTISSPENVGSRKVNGIEVAIQHLFGESGFGAGFNATFVDGDVEYDNYVLASQAVLSGLSDSANLQGFYEKDGLSVKITAAWRDQYLIGQGLPDAAGAPPQYAEEYLQWDLSVNYDVNDNMTVFFEGVNLSNETERTFSRFQSQFLSAAQYGPRYTLGFRYTMDN